MGKAIGQETREFYDDYWIQAVHFKNVAVFAVLAMCVVVLINKKGGKVRRQYIHIPDE